MFNKELADALFSLERVYLDGDDYNIKFKVAKKGDKVFDLDRVGCNIYYKRDINIIEVSGSHKSKEDFDTYFGVLWNIEIVSGDFDKLMKDIERTIKRVNLEKKLEK